VPSSSARNAFTASRSSLSFASISGLSAGQPGEVRWKTPRRTKKKIQRSRSPFGVLSPSGKFAFASPTSLARSVSVAIRSLTTRVSGADCADPVAHGIQSFPIRQGSSVTPRSTGPAHLRQSGLDNSSAASIGDPPTVSDARYEVKAKRVGRSIVSGLRAGDQRSPSLSRSDPDASGSRTRMCPACIGPLIEKGV
jgi:hypothetical protein